MIVSVQKSAKNSIRIYGYLLNDDMSCLLGKINFAHVCVYMCCGVNSERVSYTLK